MTELAPEEREDLWAAAQRGREELERYVTGLINDHRFEQYVIEDILQKGDVT